MNENMTGMTNSGDANELDELLGAYALDAVDLGERRRIEDYLTANPRAAAEVQEHREVATMLAFTGMDAPAGVWDRITAEIDAEAPSPGPELAKVLSMEPRPALVSEQPAPAIGPDEAVVAPTPIRRRANSWFLGAAAAIALVAGGAAFVAVDRSVSTDPIADAFAAAVDDSASLRTELVADGVEISATGVIDSDGLGFLEAGDLPRLADAQTYQLWGVLADTGDVVSIGILGSEPTLETFTVDGDVAALAITIEQSPGVISDGNPEGAYVGAFG